MKSLIFTLVAGMLGLSSAAMANTADRQSASTHRQAAILKPARGTDNLVLHTFVVDPGGNIIAAVSSPSIVRSVVGALLGSKPAETGWLQVYSPERQLVREIAVPFTPTALALTPDGGYLAAGDGQVAKFAADGKVIEQTTLNAMLGFDEKKLREQVVADQKASQKSDQESMARTRKAYEDMIKRYESKPELTDRDKARVASLKRTLQIISRPATEPSEAQIQSMIQSRMRIPAIGMSGSGIVITTVKHRGYEAWKTGPRFENPTKVLADLRGCCGQMDVIAAGDRILAAENTKFQVGIYDFTGKPLASFGERFKDGNDGFGSCCNPMNVICCDNGDILTAESSIGHIKRFSPEGKLIANVGRARIGGGCKHVALGHDARRDRYYVQYQDLNHICVLLPNVEAAPLVAGQDRQQKEAEAAFVKLAGRWKRQGSDEKKPVSDEGFIYMPEEELLTAMEIRPDHSMKVALSDPDRMRGDDGFRRWVVTGMEGEAVRVEIEEADGYVQFVANITVKSSDEFELNAGHTKRVFKKQ